MNKNTSYTASLDDGKQTHLVGYTDKLLCPRCGLVLKRLSMHHYFCPDCIETYLVKEETCLAEQSYQTGDEPCLERSEEAVPSSQLPSHPSVVGVDLVVRYTT